MKIEEKNYDLLECVGKGKEDIWTYEEAEIRVKKGYEKNENRNERNKCS